MRKLMAALIAFALLSGCDARKEDASRSAYKVDLGKGSPSVDFLFKDMDGKPFRLSENRGKAVLLYFWRMKCEECKEELRALDALQKKYGARGLVAVAIGADSMHSAPLYEVHKFFDKEAFSFVKLRDEDGFVAEAYSVMRAPEAYLIGRDGRIALVQKGKTDWLGPEMTAAIEKILSGEAR